MQSYIHVGVFRIQVRERKDLHVHRRGSGIRQPVPAAEHIRKGLHRDVQGTRDLRKTAAYIRDSRRRVQGNETTDERHLHRYLR